MVYCAAYGCTNRNDGKKNGITFHRFPKNPVLRAMWVAAVRRKNWSPSKISALCSQHFTSEDIDRTSLSTVRIREGSVPSVFPAFHNEIPVKPKGRRRKELKTDEDEVIEYIEELEARKHLPKCVVCSRLLVNKRKEYLGTLTSTTGLSLQQCLIGISGDKSTKIKDSAASDVVCFYCAHLINYADKLEVELAKLKAAINGCLEIKSLSEEDQEMLKPQFDSHTAILDEFSDRVVGPGSAAERGAISDKNPETEVSDIVISEVISVSVIPEPIPVKENIENTIWKKTIKRKVERVKAHKPDSGGPLEADPPVLTCQICQLRTSSRAVLLYHLRRHMANYQWCDFCDKPLVDEDDEALKQKKVRDPT